MNRIILFLFALLQAATAAAQGDARYEVTFNIPAERTQTVTGYEVLSFTLDAKRDVMLEFHGDALGRYAIVNGRKVELIHRDGRIVIPRKRTRVGINEVRTDFSVGDHRLSRHDNYLCTLAVPDGSEPMFPCLTGSDVPIRLSLSLQLPDGWKGVTEASTAPIPPSRASFTAGRLAEAIVSKNARDYHVFCREDIDLKPELTESLVADFAAAIEWMERYTGLPCPMRVPCLVVIPGYRTTDVKHPGAVIVGEKAALPREGAPEGWYLRRSELLAHEVAHLWFGSLVGADDAGATLAHETLATYLANACIQERHPEQAGSSLRRAMQRAMRADRTGATPTIGQELTQLEQAGLPYGDLTSHRALVMTHKLVELMGEENFRASLQRYLAEHAYRSVNAQQVRQAIHAANPSIGIMPHLDSWATHSGLPTIETTYRDGYLIVRRTASDDSGCGWNQKLDVRLIYEMEPSQTLTIDMLSDTVVVPLSHKPDFIIPNFTGMGYARFKLSREQAIQLAERPLVTRNPQNRSALLQTLYDNYLSGSSSPYYFGEMVRLLEGERDGQVTTLLCHHIERLLRDATPHERPRMEMSLMGVMGSNPTREGHQGIAAILAANATQTEVISQLYSLWQRQSDPFLTTADYTNLAYQLSFLKPAQAATILASQRQRLTSTVAQQEFDYVSQACTADTAARHQLFRSLLSPAERAVEPWAAQMLRLLSSHRFEPENVALIGEGLAALEDLRLTSSPDFPSEWVAALLADRTSSEARQAVKHFLDSHPDYPISLRNIILEEAYELLIE